MENSVSQSKESSETWGGGQAIVKLGTSFSEISIFQLGSWGEKLAPSGLFVCDTVERHNRGTL